jgi:hypothetical protein
MPEVMACGIGFALVKASLTAMAREDEMPTALQAVFAGRALATEMEMGSAIISRAGDDGCLLAPKFLGTEQKLR